MNTHVFASIIAGLLSTACYVPYIRDILLNKTKPEQTSWLIWSVLGTIALFSQLSLGAKASLVLVATQTVGITAVFFLSLWRGVGRPSNKDLLSLFIACQGLILWHYMQSPLLALLIVIVIDAVALGLTVQKSYKDPTSETVITWVMAGLAGVVTLATINNFNVGVLLYPIYTITLNICVLVAIFTGKRKQRVPKVVKKLKIA